MKKYTESTSSFDIDMESQNPLQVIGLKYFTGTSPEDLVPEIEKCCPSKVKILWKAPNLSWRDFDNIPYYIYKALFYLYGSFASTSRVRKLLDMPAEEFFDTLRREHPTLLDQHSFEKAVDCAVHEYDNLFFLLAMFHFFWQNRNWDIWLVEQGGDVGNPFRILVPFIFLLTPEELRSSGLATRAKEWGNVEGRDLLVKFIGFLMNPEYEQMEFDMCKVWDVVRLFQDEAKDGNEYFKKQILTSVGVLIHPETMMRDNENRYGIKTSDLIADIWHADGGLHASTLRHFETKLRELVNSTSFRHLTMAPRYLESIFHPALGPLLDKSFCCVFDIFLEGTIKIGHRRKLYGCGLGDLRLSNGTRDYENTRDYEKGFFRLGQRDQQLTQLIADRPALADKALRLTEEEREDLSYVFPITARDLVLMEGLKDGPAFRGEEEVEPFLF